MEFRNIRAKTMRIALQQATALGGPDVAIVETRKVAGGVELVVAIKTAAVAAGAAEVGQVSRRRTTPVRPVASRPAGLNPLIARLDEIGISPGIRDTVIEAMTGCDLSLSRPNDPAIPGVAAKIMGGLLKHQPLNSPAARVVSLVGPTGVGKTTTLAKLASRAAIDQGREVALITMDTYRLGAVEQLRAFADLLGVPLSVVFTPRDLQEALAKYSHVDQIFIDTTGRGPLDLRRVKEIRAFLAAVRAISLLALPAGARRVDLQAAGRTFGILQPAGLVITKWDETLVPGEIISYALEAGLPLTWVSDGQEVPADIHRALPEMVCRAAITGKSFTEIVND